MHQESCTAALTLLSEGDHEGLWIHLFPESAYMRLNFLLGLGLIRAIDPSIEVRSESDAVSKSM